MSAIFENTPHRLESVARATSVNHETMTLEAVISTNLRDREGDIVDAQGLDFSNYLKNPVVLWAHNLNKAAIAKILRITVTDHSVLALIQFSDTEEGRRVFALYADGFLRGWSMGFIPKRSRPLGDDLGAHILEAEVVEVSAVPVPANPEALTKGFNLVDRTTSYVSDEKGLRKRRRKKRLREIALFVAQRAASCFC